MIRPMAHLKVSSLASGAPTEMTRCHAVEAEHSAPV